MNEPDLGQCEPCTAAWGDLGLECAERRSIAAGFKQAEASKADDEVREDT